MKTSIQGFNHGGTGGGAACHTVRSYYLLSTVINYLEWERFTPLFLKRSQTITTMKCVDDKYNLL